MGVLTAIMKLRLAPNPQAHNPGLPASALPSAAVPTTGDLPPLSRAVWASTATCANTAVKTSTTVPPCPRARWSQASHAPSARRDTTHAFARVVVETGIRVRLIQRLATRLPVNVEERG